jgi:putative thioredoxin
MTNFAGAFDLSRLAQKNQPASTTQQPAAGALTSWLVKADEQILRQYIAISEKTPVLLLIADQSPESTEVRAMVEKAIRASEGRFAGIEIDITSSPQLAQAVGVATAPALVAVLAGQPAPLFQGKPETEQLLQVLSQVLQLAQQNGLTERVSVGTEPVVSSEPELSPAHQEAIAEIEAGNLEVAYAKFEKLTIEYPNDKDALAGFNQVKLMLRLQRAPESEFDKVLLGADQLLISGSAAGAFSLLLDLYPVSDDQEAIRARLLELFTLVGEGDQDVLNARRRLASLMF